MTHLTPWGRHSSWTIPLVGAGLLLATHCAQSPVGDEACRLVRDVGIRRDAVVAEIGAGDGRFAVELSRCLGTRARVYATELGREKVALLWKSVQGSGAPHLTVMEGTPDSTMLPDDSCDVVIVRRTYHHFSHPAEMARSIWKTLRRDGLLVAIEQPSMPLSESRQTGPRPGGDGIKATTLSQELALAGFNQVKIMEVWSGDLYLSIFRKSP